MASRYVTVRVVGQDGRPKQGRRVGIHGTGYLDVVGGVYTDSTGEAELGIDFSGAIDIYVDGQPVKKSVPIQARITVVV